MMKTRTIFCIDLRSFFASVECADAGLNIYEVPLVVADRTRGNGSITLAVTPYLKEKGVPSRGRVWELPKNEPIIFAKPRMRRYVEISSKIISIYLNYVSEEDIYIYSIDEAFLDVTEYLHYFDMGAEELAYTIQQDVLRQTKISSTCGIGPNMLMAKLALDLDSKQSMNGIAHWTEEDIETRLWPVEPLHKVWGIGNRIEKRLNKMGIQSMYDLAHYDIDELEKEFGIYGVELYHHAHGEDYSRMQGKREFRPINESIGHGQTLYYDYDAKGAKQVMLELVDRITKRMRARKKVGSVVHLHVAYSKATPGGFGRQTTIVVPTDSASEIYAMCEQLFDRFYDGRPVRKVSISVGNLKKSPVIQMDLFGLQYKRDREKKLFAAVDAIHDWYGKNTLLRAVNFTDKSTMMSRNGLIGGHRA